ncbi:D-2-hydroxyacid dehydrogenase [Chryseobacterium sp. A301]
MKILANDGISKSGLERFRQAGLEVIEHRVAQEQLPDFINENGIEILLVRSATQVTRELIDQCPSLKIIGRGGIGMDNIDLEYASELGIQVVNTPISSARSVAELVFAHFFTLARFLHESNRLMPLEGESQFNALKKSFATAVELQGKTLGVIGFGAVGQEVVKMGLSLGMKVKVCTRTARKETVEIEFFDSQRVSFELQTTQDLPEFLKDLDFLSVNTPKSKTYLLDTPEFERMKRGIRIVNTARGGVINEVSLLDAIEEGIVTGAALDVFESEPHPELPLLMNPSLSLSPHLGGSTLDAQEKIGRELAERILSLIQ